MGLFNNRTEIVRENHVQEPAYTRRALKLMMESVREYGVLTEFVAASVFDRKGYETLGPVNKRMRNSYSRGDGDDIYVHVAVRLEAHMYGDEWKALLADIATDEQVKMERAKAKSIKKAALMEQKAALEAELAALEND